MVQSGFGWRVPWSCVLSDLSDFEAAAWRCSGSSFSRSPPRVFWRLLKEFLVCVSFHIYIYIWWSLTLVAFHVHVSSLYPIICIVFSRNLVTGRKWWVRKEIGDTKGTFFSGEADMPKNCLEKCMLYYISVLLFSKLLEKDFVPSGGVEQGLM